MTFRGALVSRGMYMGISIDQMMNDGYFPTQKDHLHLLEGVSKNIWSNTHFLVIWGLQLEGPILLRSKGYMNGEGCGLLI